MHHHESQDIELQGRSLLAVVVATEGCDESSCKHARRDCRKQGDSGLRQARDGCALCCGRKHEHRHQEDTRVAVLACGPHNTHTHTHTLSTSVARGPEHLFTHVPMDTNRCVSGSRYSQYDWCKRSSRLDTARTTPSTPFAIVRSTLRRALAATGRASPAECAEGGTVDTVSASIA